MSSFLQKIGLQSSQSDEEAAVSPSETSASLLGDKNPFAALTSQYTENANETNEVNEMCPELTYQQRIMGFAVCMGMGYIIGFGGLFRFNELLLGNPKPFVLMYTVGNLVALSGSFFLTGPNAQFKKMFHESRKAASVVYLVTLFTTLSVVFVPSFTGKAFVLLLLCIIETLALTWYCLSYVPYGQTYVKNTFQRLMES